MLRVSTCTLRRASTRPALHATKQPCLVARGSLRPSSTSTSWTSLEQHHPEPSATRTFAAATLEFERDDSHHNEEDGNEQSPSSKATTTTEGDVAVGNAFQTETRRMQEFDDEIRQQTTFILEDIPYGKFTPEDWDRALWLLEKWSRSSRMANTPEGVDQSFVLLDRLVMEQEAQAYHPLSCQLNTPLLRRLVFNWNRCVKRFHQFSQEKQALLRYEYTPMELLARLENYAERSPRLQLDTRTLNYFMDAAWRCSTPSRTGMPNMISPRLATSFVESLFDRMDAPNRPAATAAGRAAPEDPAAAASYGADTHHHPQQHGMVVAEQQGDDGEEDGHDYATASHPNNPSRQHHRYLEIRKRSGFIPTTPDKYTYTSMIQLFAHNGMARRAEALVNKLYKAYVEHKAEKLKPDLAVFTAVLNALNHSDEEIQAAQRAEDILNRMQELADCGLIPEVAPDEMAYLVVLTCYAKRTSTREANGKRTHSGKKLKSAEECFKRTQELFAKMQQLGFASASAYNIMMKALGNVRKPEEAELTFKRMLDEYASGNKSAQPDDISFNTLLRAWSLSNDPRCGDRAEELLAEYEGLYRAGIVSDPPDRVTYNSVLTCFAQALQAERANALLDHMKQTRVANGVSISPDTVSYNVVMDAYAKRKNPRRAEQLLEEMYKDFTEMRQARNSHILVRPNEQSFTIVLHAWLKSGHSYAPERAEAILETMRRISEAGVLDVAPGNAAYYIVVGCWCQAQTQEAPFRAQKVLDSMEDMFNNGSATVRPDESIYDEVISAFCNNSLPYRAEEILERQHQQSTPAAQGGGGNLKAKPAPRAYHKILGAYNRLKTPEAAERAEVLYKRWLSRFESGAMEYPPGEVAAKLVCAAWSNASRYDPNAAHRIKEFLHFTANQTRLAKSSNADTVSLRLENSLSSESSASTNTAVLDTFCRLQDAPSAHGHFLWMCNEFLKGAEQMKPNLEDLDLALSSWRKSKAREAHTKMVELLEKVKEMSHANQIDWMPTIKSYRILFNCLEDMRSMDAAMQAQVLLEQLQQQSEASEEYSLVEARDYIQVVRIWTKLDNHDGMLLADAAFHRMTQRYTPSAATYDLLIKAWSRSNHLVSHAKIAELRAEKAIIHGTNE